MIKVLHGADFHLDSPFDSLPEEKAVMRRGEQRGLLNNLAELANQEKVDVVLLAGDLLDSDKSYYETGEALIRAFEKITAPVFIAPGNHDYYHKRSPWSALKLPKHVHVFTAPTPQGVEIANGKAVIWGAAFTAPRSQSLLEGFPGIARGRAFHLMALHGQMGGAEQYNPITPKQIAATGLHYLALGHEHSYSGLLKAGDTYYAYSGSPEGRGFDELGPRGVVIAEVERDMVEARFVSLGGRQYHKLHVDLDGKSQVRTAIANALPKNTKRDIYRIILTGEFDGKLDLAAMEKELENRFFHLTIRDETQIPRNIWAQAEEDTLRGLFLRKMRDRYEAGDEQEREKVVSAIRFAIGAMENREQWRT